MSKSKMTKIVTKNIDEILPSDKNPRKISDENLEYLKRSVERFGLVQPIIVNKTTSHIVGGHQRVKALRALGYKTIEVIEVELDQKDEYELNIALNSPKMQGEFDNAKMGELMREFASLDVDVSELSNLGLDSLFEDAMATVSFDTDVTNTMDDEIRFDDGPIENAQPVETVKSNMPTTTIKQAIKAQAEESGVHFEFGGLRSNIPIAVYEMFSNAFSDHLNHNKESSMSGFILKLLGVDSPDAVDKFIKEESADVWTDD